MRLNTLEIYLALADHHYGDQLHSTQYLPMPRKLGQPKAKAHLSKSMMKYRSHKGMLTKTRPLDHELKEYVSGRSERQPTNGFTGQNRSKHLMFKSGGKPWSHTLPDD